MYNFARDQNYPQVNLNILTYFYTFIFISFLEINKLYYFIFCKEIKDKIDD